MQMTMKGGHFMSCFPWKASIAFGLIFWLTALAMARQDYSLLSPDKRIEIKIHAADRLKYDLFFKGKALLQDSHLSINIDHVELGLNPKVASAREGSSDRVLEPPVRQKFAKIRDHYNQLRLEMAGGLTVEFRAYNEGAAYRLETALPQAQVHVCNEEAIFHFTADDTVYYPSEESFFSHNERKYLPQTISQIAPASLATLPAVVDPGDGVKVAIAESDLEDYPGLWLHGTSGAALAATFPPYPLKQQLEKDRDFKVVESADYIAVTRGTRTFPWRVIAIAEKDGDLLTNQLVWLLEKPSQVEDTSWIKPGKVAWDWWNANNVYDVDFKAGINTQTYKYYIDFAAKYGILYIIVDEGWYKLGSILDVVPDMNIAEITAYGKQKNVGVILWVIWKTLDDQLIPALDQYQKWGVKGIKVDFMQRSDQLLINYFHKVSSETAKRKMLVDFHGCQKTATMTRTWPNLISTEGVRGL
jgi:alpha-glucosidase